MALSEEEILREAGRIRARRRLRVAKTCAVCGKPFEGIAQARYCSDACRMAAARERNAARAETEPADDVAQEAIRIAERLRDDIIRYRTDAIARGEMDPSTLPLTPREEEANAAIGRVRARAKAIYERVGLLDDSTELIRQARLERTRQLTGE